MTIAPEAPVAPTGASAPTPEFDSAKLFVNRASDEPADDDAIAFELDFAGIEVCRLEPFRDERAEVKTSVRGGLHGWSFERAWRYWIASGPGIEVGAAERLHAKHGHEVRVAGHCGCPSPRDWFKGLAVGSYHVDSPSGLKALADTIRSLVSPTDSPAPAAGVSKAEVDAALKAYFTGMWGRSLEELGVLVPGDGRPKAMRAALEAAALARQPLTAADHLRLADDILHDAEGEHAEWAHGLIHQAAAHLSDRQDIRDQARQEALACNGYDFARPPAHDTEGAEPVRWEWRTHDSSDGWMLAPDEAQARRLARTWNGKIRPLYAALQPPVPGGQSDEWPAPQGKAPRVPCPHCGRHTHCRIDENIDGSYRPGWELRCVECKTTFRDPQAPTPAPSGPEGEEEKFPLSYVGVCPHPGHQPPAPSNAGEDEAAFVERMAEECITLDHDTLELERLFALARRGLNAPTRPAGDGVTKAMVEAAVDGFLKGYSEGLSRKECLELANTAALRARTGR